MIYSTLYVIRPILNFVRALLGDYFGLCISFLLIAGGLAIYVTSQKRIRHRSVSLKILVVFSLLSYLFGLYYLKIPEEKIHLIEYGILAFLVFRALQFDLKKDIYLYGLSFLIVSGFGAADELIQHVLPNRVGDMRDVFLNASSGILGLMIAFSLDAPNCEP